MNQDRIKSLHDLYQTLSGKTIPLTLPVGYRWEVWILAGFSEDDLRLVIEYLRRRIKERKRSQECLRFSYLIQDTDLFAEHLSMARPLARVPVVDDRRASVLTATGRSGEHKHADARPMRDLIAENKALAELRALKESL